MTTVSQYRGLKAGLKSYWDCYGGFAAVGTSPFFHVSILLSLILLPLWWDGDWWTTSLEIVPAILGFSIASFTIMLGLGDESFRLLLGVKRSANKESTLTNVSSGFFHFIFVQVIAILLALVAEARPIAFLIQTLGTDVAGLHPFVQTSLVIVSKIFRFTGTLLLVYTLMTALAAMLNVFRLARIFSEHATAQFSKKKRAEDPRCNCKPPEPPKA